MAEVHGRGNLRDFLTAERKQRRRFSGRFLRRMLVSQIHGFRGEARRKGTVPIDMKSWIFTSRNLIILTACVLPLYILAFHFNLGIYDILLRRQYVTDNPPAGNRTKKILYWNTMFGDKSFYLGSGDVFHDCPVNNCYATHDRFHQDLEDFDAVLFHGNELDLQDLPGKRSPRQWYVFVNLESPRNRPLTNQYYEDYFNLTMTYRLDSDVVWTYGTVKNLTTDQAVAPFPNTTWPVFHDHAGEQPEDPRDESLRDTIQGKKKPVVWFVSNCHAANGRDRYVDELSKHIKVDVYGKCGTHECPRNKDCFGDIVEPLYFFHLSFENSFCQDYVTEKLYNALSYNVVPIVYGGANYSLFAPPKSYINALDFDTPEQLAEYLNWLMDRPRIYMEFFEWKKYYRIDESNHQVICKLCELLHEKRKPRAYQVLSDWYSKSKCPLQRYLSHVPYLTSSVLKNQD